MLEQLFAEVDRACETERHQGARPRAALRAVLAFFAANSPSARLVAIEILATAREGIEHRDAAVEALSRRLQVNDPSTEELSLGFTWIKVAGMLALIGLFVIAGEASRIPALEDEFADALALGG